MRVLVIGGTGFLGSHLVPKLVERGHQVSVLTRRKAEVPRLESQGVTGIQGDLMEPAAILSRVPPQDAVVLMAMPLTFGRMSRKRFRETRYRTTQFVATTLALGEKLSCPTILTQGTSYRARPGDVIDERHPIDRFGITEVGEPADRMIADAMKRGVPPLVRMLPGQIYGPGGLFMEMYRRMKSGKFGIVGRGDNHIPRVHVKDCAEAFARAIEKRPVGESFIIADDTPCTVRAFTEFLAKCTGLPKPRTIPRFLARLALGKRLLDTLEMDCVVTNAKAKRELGWKPTFLGYREGLVATVREIESMGSPQGDEP